jgi:TRAP-type C4-dicarboxylate transport system substrate-binding protein
VTSDGPAAEAARAEFRDIIAQQGHAVDIARDGVARLERAFDEGALTPTPFLEDALRDLRAALDQEAGQKLGGKSAEAARFILRAIDRALDEA